VSRFDDLDLFELAKQNDVLDEESVRRLVLAAGLSGNGVLQDCAVRAVLGRSVEQWEYPFSSPVSGFGGGVCLGRGFDGRSLCVGEGDLSRHLLAAGQSGSGKTTLFYNLFEEVGVPCWFFDLKQDYRHLLQKQGEEDGEGFLLVLPWTEFCFNPLQPPRGVSPRRWAQVFAEVFGHSTSLLSGSKNYLMRKVVELYRLYGLFDGVSAPFPSLHELELLVREDGINFVRKQADYRDTVLNRLEAMNLVAGTVFDCSQGVSVPDLLGCDVVFEFDGLGRDVQNFLMEILFAYVYEYRLAQGHRNAGLRHLFFLDEGKRVFSVYKERQSASGIPEVDELTAKMREFGEGLVVGDQEPGKLTDSIKANTFTKVLLPMGDRKQFEQVAGSMDLTQRQMDFAQSLEVGEAVVQVGNQDPVPIQVDDYSLSKQVSDEELRKQQQQRWNKLRFEERQTTQRFKERLSNEDVVEKKQVPSDPQTIDLSDDGVRLLEDVVRNPFKPLTERYSVFSSSYKGNKAKNELVEQGVVIERVVKTGSQRKLLELTEKGRDHVEDSLDLEVKHRGRGGVVHRFWQHQIHDLFEEAGWPVFLEKFDADIYVNMGTTELAVEVATGDNPREIQHVEKHLDRDFQVWVACRNSDVRDGLQQRLADNDVPSENVVFRLFREFNDNEHLPV